MSNLKIRQALETGLITLTPNVPTGFENADFIEVEGQPSRDAYVLFAKPENPTMGDDFYRQSGIFQVTLRWPIGEGTEAIGLHADLVRKAFHRGLSLFADNVQVTIDATPEIPGGQRVVDRYVIVMRIEFHADLFEGNN